MAGRIASSSSSHFQHRAPRIACTSRHFRIYVLIGQRGNLQPAWGCPTVGIGGRYTQQRKVQGCRTASACNTHGMQSGAAHHIVVTYSNTQCCHLQQGAPSHPVHPTRHHHRLLCPRCQLTPLRITCSMQNCTVSSTRRGSSRAARSHATSSANCKQTSCKWRGQRCAVMHARDIQNQLQHRALNIGRQSPPSRTRPTTCRTYNVVPSSTHLDMLAATRRV
jgi:hypothetical protein